MTNAERQDPGSIDPAKQWGFLKSGSEAIFCILDAVLRPLSGLQDTEQHVSANYLLLQTIYIVAAWLKHGC